MQHAGMGEIETQARKEGMRTMYEDGLVKALAGTTTIEEVMRVTQDG
jgi:general secretion pathway protein E